MTSRSIVVREATDVAAARRDAQRLAAEIGLSEVEAGRVALVVSEAASNMLKHTGEGGEVLLRPFTRAEKNGVEMLGLDRGPGLVDVPRCLTDGYSTTGTMGGGLGAIGRLADEWDLLASKAAGTVLLARVWHDREPADAASEPLEVGAVSVPVRGEHVNGDGWIMRERPGGRALLVCDGLGHGPGAAEASARAIELFSACDRFSPSETIRVLHKGMTSTRGAAVAVAHFDVDTGGIRYAAVGNIAAAIHTPTSVRHLVSLNGTVGYALSGVQEFRYEWPSDDALLVVHTDGLESRWSLAGYPGVFVKDPALLAGALYREYARGRDDVTVLVVRRARRDR